MILVIGGRGRSGRLVVENLLSAGESIRVLTRKPSHPIIQSFADRGVDIAVGNIQQPETFENILNGVNRVYYISSGEDGICEEVSAAKNFIDRVKLKKIEHFVFQSVLFSKTNLPHCKAKGIIHDHLQKSGLPYTILSPGFFFEALYESVNLLIQQRTLSSEVSDLKFPTTIPVDPSYPWTDLNDIGRVAAELLTKTGPLYKEVAIFSEPLITAHEIVDFLGGLLKIKVRAELISLRNRDMIPFFVGKNATCELASYLSENELDYYYSPIQNWKYSKKNYENSKSITRKDCSSLKKVLAEYLKQRLG